MQHRGDAAGRNRVADHQPRAVRGRVWSAPDRAQTAASGGQVEAAIDDLVGDLVDLAQATEIHLAGGHAHDLGHFRQLVLARQVRERHHDRGRRGQHVASQLQAIANQIDRVFQARRGGAVLVQAPCQLDDEADARLQRGAGALATCGILHAHGRNDAVLCPANATAFSRDAAGFQSNESMLRPLRRYRGALEVSRTGSRGGCSRSRRVSDSVTPC